MSMINDALKRAKKTQQEKPPATPPLEFKPVEPTQESRPRGPLLIVATTLAAIVVVAMGMLLIQAITQQREANLQAQARMAITNAPVAPLGESTNVAGLSPEEAMTNALPAELVETPKPEFKLQGILFNPKSPSAVVNGRTIYVGDRVSGFRVLAITPDSVTVVNATQTNVLSLSQ